MFLRFFVPKIMILKEQKIHRVKQPATLPRSSHGFPRFVVLWGGLLQKIQLRSLRQTSIVRGGAGRFLTTTFSHIKNQLNVGHSLQFPIKKIILYKLCISYKMYKYYINIPYIWVV